MKRTAVPALSAFLFLGTGCAPPAGPAEPPASAVATHAEALFSSLEACSPDQWCWQTPTHSTNALTGLSAIGKNRLIVGDAQTRLKVSSAGKLQSAQTGASWQGWSDLWTDSAGTSWAVGAQGQVAKRGSSGVWTPVAAPISEDLVGIWGTASNQIWAVGAKGHAIRYDGTSWTAFDTGFISAELYGIWASGPNDVWISGFNIIERFDGTSWTPLPYDGGEANMRFHVWGADANNVWVVADNSPQIQKFNPATKAMSAVTGVQIWSGLDIRGTGANDLWVMGNYDLVHFDGTNWTAHAREWGPTPVSLPGGMSMSGFTHVRPVGASESWLLGTGGGLARYDGKAWSAVGMASGLSPNAHSLLFLGADDLWMIADNGYSRFDGSTWTRTDVSFPGPTWYGGIVAATAAGGTVLRLDRASESYLAVQKYNGASWDQVGGDLPCFDPFFMALWASALDDIYMSGNSDLFRYDGSAWHDISLPNDGNLSILAISGTAPNNVWVIATDGFDFHPVLYRFDGTSWTSLLFPAATPSEEVFSVWTDRSGHGFIGGAGKVFEVTGTTLTTHALPNGDEIVSFAGSSTDLYGVGSSGVSGSVLHFDGSTWQEQSSGAGNPLRSVAISPDGSVWATDRAGILHKQP